MGEISQGNSPFAFGAMGEIKWSARHSYVYISGDFDCQCDDLHDLSDIQWDRRKQRADSIPHNLHTNTNQQKRRKPDNDSHSRLAEHLGESIGKSVAEENADGDQTHGKDRGKDNQDVDSVAMRRIRSQGDRY
jgi:hypothetical protein